MNEVAVKKDGRARFEIAIDQFLPGEDGLQPVGVKNPGLLPHLAVLESSQVM